MGFVISLIIILGIQLALQFFLYRLGVAPIYVEIIVDLVLAFIFAIFNYNGDKKEAFKDPTFHRNFAILFAILIIIDLLFNFLG